MKRFCSILCAILLGMSTLFAEENLIANGDFEIASSNFLFGAQFEDWSFGAEIAIETTDVYDGQQALRTVNVTQKRSLQQDVDLRTDVIGQEFELTIHYKVLEAQAGDLALNSAWLYARPTEGVHDSAALNQELPIGSGWQELKVSTTKPQDATYLTVSVAVKKGAKVIFDGFSLKRTESATPWFTVFPEKINAVTAQVNEEKLMATLTIRQGNLTQPISLSITGANAEMFALEKTVVTAAEEQVKLWYKPTAAGVHKAMLLVDSQEATQDFVSLSLSGSASDPNLQPELTISPTTLPQFSTIVGGYAVDSVRVHSLNCTEDITVTILNDDEYPAFTISSTLLPKNMEAQTRITFHPTKAGTYSATIYWSSAGVQKQQMKLTGTTNGAPTDPTEEWSKDFHWDMSKPYALLNEHFDNIEHNKTLTLTDWQNVVLKGDRPWWGYEDKEDGTVVERCAKATAYIYQEQDSLPWEMWLVTPALDYKNAAEQIFTFRVRGDYLFQGQSAALTVFFVDATTPEDVFFQDLEIPMPQTEDEAGDWQDIHINLSGQEYIPDVFFMAFRFTGNSGQTGSSTYLIDDVSWGRTDLPAIIADSTLIRLTTQPGKIEAVALNIEGKNLTESISIALGGSNPSNFTITPTSLPTEGGVLGVGFQSSELGVHEAYLRLRSRGAADVFIPMAVLGEAPTAIGSTESASEENRILLIDGQMLIVTNKGTYTLLGKRVDGKN